MANTKETQTGPVRNLSVRFDDGRFKTLVLIARVKDCTMGEVIRQAFDVYTQTLTQDAAWRDEVAQLAAELSELVEPAGSLASV